MTIDLVIMVALTVLAVLAVVDDIRQRIKLNTVIASLSQQIIDNLAIQKALQDEQASHEQTKLQNTDGFVKFLSDSREQAFDYIEKMQDELTVLITDLEQLSPDIGEFQSKKISAAVREIKSMLPQNDK